MRIPHHLVRSPSGLWSFRQRVPADLQAIIGRRIPAAKANVKNGAGNWITKAFGRHLEQVGANWPEAKRGFHSLRKTLIQELQGAGVVPELRAQLVGHELDDEHHATYSRTFTVREKLEGLKGVSPGLAVLSYGLTLSALTGLLKQ